MQTAVDAKNHLIVAADVTNNPADQGQLQSMAKEAKKQFVPFVPNIQDFLVNLQRNMTAD